MNAGSGDPAYRNWVNDVVGRVPSRGNVPKPADGLGIPKRLDSSGPADLETGGNSPAVARLGCRILSAPHAAPDGNLATKERALAVRKAVSHLPDDLREAVVLCELDDRAIAEAAAILQTTPKAVESRLYRARKILRERLATWL